MQKYYCDVSSLPKHPALSINVFEQYLNNERSLFIFSRHSIAIKGLVNFLKIEFRTINSMHAIPFQIGANGTMAIKHTTNNGKM
jgi:hypothetical protein